MAWIDRFPSTRRNPGFAVSVKPGLAQFVDPSLTRRVAALDRSSGPIDEAAYGRLDRDYLKQAPIVPFGTRTLVASFSGRVDLRGFVWNPTFETDLTSLRFKPGAPAGKRTSSVDEPKDVP